MKIKSSIFISLALTVVFSGCTKLEQQLQDGLTTNPSAGGVDIATLLNSAYNNMNGLLHSQDRIFSLTENTTDESLVPTRGGDWDDNGVWRVMHSHKWTQLHDQIKQVFNGLGAIESGAITTLAFNPGPEQAAEAYFIRSFAQYYYLSFYGQVPFREIKDYNSIDIAPVMTPAAAVDTLITTLTRIIPVLDAANAPYKASPDAARFLLMKVYLNKGTFLNPKAPTFDAADMAKVIELGNEIINTGTYSFTPTYFDNFSASNGTLSKERIFAWHNTGAAQASDKINSGGINARWMMGLHYNSWTAKKGSAGWNGFSTVADFYNTFTANDQRIGGTPYPGVTDTSGLLPGFAVGLQHDKNGVALTDRQGNPLSFTPDVKLIETDSKRLEVAGIRVIKYPPDYTAYDGGNQRNQLQIFRYADVWLTVAEAKARSGDEATALAMVNTLRTARGATPMVAFTLVNADNVDDPNTLLAERGRELYWESWRREDLIRFGVFLKPWALKEADDDPEKNLLFPIAVDQLLANPNLHQNPGY
jgi:hypothetical protein